MIEGWLLEKNKLIVYAIGGIAIYADVNGKVHQGIIYYFVSDTPVWGELFP